MFRPPVCFGATGGKSLSDRFRFDLSRALVIAGFIFYIPANFLPVMTITITGEVEPLTVMGGVWELYETGLAPVALIVFLASVVVPLLKLSIMAWILVLHGTDIHRQRRMELHGFLLKIGTWAMIDIFLLSVLTAVGQLGILASVTPERGALFYAAMLISNVLATDIYKPWLIWQESEPQSS
jgi:paraquat-inducible protein A